MTDLNSVKTSWHPTRIEYTVTCGFLNARRGTLQQYAVVLESYGLDEIGGWKATINGESAWESPQRSEEKMRREVDLQARKMYAEWRDSRRGATPTVDGLGSSLGRR